MLKTSLAIGAGKAVAGLTHLLKLGSGTSLPGKVARRVNPGLLRQLGQQVRHQVIAVTGTNGKTTTCGLLAQFLREAGGPVLHNQLGANMVPGITAALVQHSALSGKLNADYAVLEVDEASLRGLAREMDLQRVVVTNLFRDQLDRYGELDTTARMIREGIAQTGLVQGQGRLILNADDPLVSALGQDACFREQDNVLYFGIEAVEYLHARPMTHPVPFNREVTQCPVCQGALHYTLSLFGHLGHYHCERCEYRRPRPAVSAEHILVKPDESIVRLRFGTDVVELVLKLPGLFNVYNLLAAAAVVYDLYLTSDLLAKGLNQYQSVFGRAEKRLIQGKSVMIMLIKNPVGASEVLKLVGGDPRGKLLIALNDQYADGRDVSWIWDAQFEAIATSQPVVVSGLRAADMAIRLKYAGLPDTHIIVQPDLQAALDTALTQTQPDETLYVLPTYTALLQLTKLLG